MQKNSAGPMGAKHIRIITATAMCVAAAVVLRVLGIMVPFGGVGGMRISLAGIFTSIPAILFGPVYGAIAGGLTDFLGVFIKPEGAWIPWLTLTAIALGVLRSLLWRAISGVRGGRLEKMGYAVFGFLIALGSFNTVSTALFEGSAWAALLMHTGNKLWAFTYGLIIVGAAGAIGLALSGPLLSKIGGRGEDKELFVKLLSVLMAPGIIISTVNTYILLQVLKIPLGFVAFWLPRIIEEIAVSVIVAYALTLLLPLIKGFGSGRKNKQAE